LKDGNDYMAASFTLDKEDTSRTKHLRGRFEKREKPERQIESKVSLKEKMEETREKGLSRSIPSENIGFKMLKMMGYKEGKGIGKNENGRVNPIGVFVKHVVSSIEYTPTVIPTYSRVVVALESKKSKRLQRGGK
jgi:hypothetical protein